MNHQCWVLFFLDIAVESALASFGTIFTFRAKIDKVTGLKFKLLSINLFIEQLYVRAAQLIKFLIAITITDATIM